MMKKEKLEKTDTQQLRKTRKFGKLAIVLLTVAFVLDVFVLVYDVIIGDGFTIPLFVSAVACFVIFIPIYWGNKRIDKELKRRENE
jgi:magnesium-transporting ATPase (P-type)